MRWTAEHADSRERIVLPEGFVQPEYHYVGSEPRSKSVRERIESQLVKQGISGARIFESVDIFHDYARFETDFVLLIPNFPIILIEVKDVRSDVELTQTKKHVRVKYSDGMKDVTLQIKRAEDALKRWIDDIKRCYSFETGTPTFVAFLYLPAYEFDRDTLLKANSQHRTLHKPDNNTLIREILDHARKQGSSAPGNGSVDRGKWTPVGQRDIDFLTRWLCAEPRVRTWVSRSSKRRHFSASRVELEYDRLLGLRMNRDLFVEGAAGTGKTRLALQLWKAWGKDTRRSALVLPSPAAARRCAAFLKAAPSATHVVTNWKSLVEDLWPGRSAPRSAELAPSFWAGLEQRLRAINGHLRSAQRYDLIIVDDVQDVPTPVLAQLRDTLSASGSLVMFGDPRQELEVGFRPGNWPVTRVVLSRGVRATEPISTVVAAAAGLNPAEFTKDALAGPTPKYLTVPGADLSSAAADVVESVRAQRGWQPAHITVLSLTGGSPKPPRSALKDIRWDPVEDFQGQESEVVILMLDAAADEASGDPLLIQTLVYMGLSRARDELYVLEPAGAGSLLPADVLGHFEMYDEHALSSDVGAKETPRD